MGWVSRQALAYSTTTLGATLINSVFQLYYVQLFIEEYGMTSTWFYGGQGAYMLWNAVNDPFFGWLMDRRTSAGTDEHGNRGVYARAIASGGPLFALSFLLPWFPWTSNPAAHPHITGMHFIVSLCTFDGAFTWVVLAQSALFAELENQSTGRSQVLAVGQVASVVGSLGVFASNLYWTQDTPDLQGFRIFSVVCAMLALFCFTATGKLALDAFRDHKEGLRLVHVVNGDADDAHDHDNHDDLPLVALAADSGARLPLPSARNAGGGQSDTDTDNEDHDPEAPDANVSPTHQLLSSASHRHLDAFEVVVGHGSERPDAGGGVRNRTAPAVAAAASDANGTAPGTPSKAGPHGLRKPLSSVQSEQPEYGMAVYWQILSSADFNRFQGVSFLQVLNTSVADSFYTMFFTWYGGPTISALGLSTLMGGSSVITPGVALLLMAWTSRSGTSYGVIRGMMWLKLLGCVMVGMVGRHCIPLLVAFMVFNRSVTAATLTLYNLSVTDLIDADRALHNRPRRLSSTFFGLNALFTKPAQSVAPMLVVAILTAHGYAQHHQHVTGEAVDPQLLEVGFHILWLLPAVSTVLQLVLWQSYTLRGAGTGTARRVVGGSDAGGAAAPPTRVCVGKDRHGGAVTATFYSFLGSADGGAGVTVAGSGGRGGVVEIPQPRPPPPPPPPVESLWGASASGPGAVAVSSRHSPNPGM